MMAPQTVIVVDNDPSTAHVLAAATSHTGLRVSAYGSASRFLDHYDDDPGAAPSCLVIDTCLPGISGLDLQVRIAKSINAPPVIMLSSRASVRLAVEVMSRGAMTLLEKPYRIEELTHHIQRAILLDSRRRETEREQREMEAKFSTLTHKEREVFELIAQGKTNKAIAANLRLSVRAVEDRRARLMKKLGVRSVAELITIPYEPLVLEMS